MSRPKKYWRKLRILEEWLIALAAPPLIFLLRVVPLSWIYPMGRAAGRLFGVSLRRRKKIALANLRLVFGTSKTEWEIRRIYRAFLARAVVNSLEIIKFALLPPEVMRERIEIVGRENLERAVKRGKGVIAVSVHLGNFPVIGSRLASEGYRFAFILKYPRNREMTALIERYRKHVGISLIDGWNKRFAAQASLQQLRDGGILCILLDQNPPYADVMVDFFGYPVPSFKGPVILAARTEAAVLPIFMVGNVGARHTIVIEKPFRLEMTGDKERDTIQNLSRLVKLTEKYVEQYPDQWWWWHRRWKKHIDYKHL